MVDNHSHRVRIPGNDSSFDLQLHQSSCSTGNTGSSLWPCPSVLESTTAHNHAFVVKAAMEKASQQPDGHRLAVLPSRANSSVAVIEVENLTTSDQQLILSRAMETNGQDNERLLSKIRERQDRYRDHLCVQVATNWCLPSKFVTALANMRHASIRQLDISASMRRLTEAGHMPHSNVTRPSAFKTIMCLTFRVGVEWSRVAVQFRDVSFEAEVLVGSAGLPSVSNTFKTWAQVTQNPPCLNPGSHCSKRVRPLLSWELQSPYTHTRRYSRQQVP